MIEVFCRNQLGNILFQYAVGRHLAAKHKTGLRLHLLGPEGRDTVLHSQIVQSRINQLSFFNLKAEILPPDPTDITKPSGVSNSYIKEMLFVETKWGFNPEVLTLKDGVCLDGNFQCEKYFSGIEQLIRQDFEIKLDLLENECANYLQKIQNTNSIAVHVRRGDYVNLELHDVCNNTYYSNSIAYMNTRIDTPHYFVFSDDISWCMANFDLPECTFVELSASRENPMIDFMLMSLCKHNIIANSTFSWWPAWLNSNNGKVVVGPRHWFNNEDKLDWLICQDTVPDHWVRVDV